jgi:uncharacterized protein (DUF952 family)
VKIVCKIVSEDDWRAAKASGKVAPAPIDVSDGYIHLSTEDQTLETARLHFAGRDDLVAVAFNVEAFGRALRWENSRGGALFPHLYADLPAAKATSARRLIRRGDGFEFGEAIR